MKIIDIETNSYGFITGRDALILKDINWDSHLVLKLNVNALADSFSKKINTPKDEIELVFSFEEVYMFRVSELEMRGLMSSEELDKYLNNAKTIFTEILDSNIILENTQYNKDLALRHFVLDTYDFRLEPICCFSPVLTVAS